MEKELIFIAFLQWDYFYFKSLHIHFIYNYVGTKHQGIHTPTTRVHITPFIINIAFEKGQ